LQFEEPTAPAIFRPKIERHGQKQTREKGLKALYKPSILDQNDSPFSYRDIEVLKIDVRALRFEVLEVFEELKKGCRFVQNGGFI
jgi:hypothetical protein